MHQRDDNVYFVDSDEILDSENGRKEVKLIYDGKALASQKVMDMTSNIYDKVTDVLKFSQENDTSTYNAAIQLAKNRIHNISEK